MTGKWGVNYQQGQIQVLLSSSPRLRLALKPTKPPIHKVAGALSMVVKKPVHEADHSPSSILKVKNVQSSPLSHTPQESA